MRNMVVGRLHVLTDYHFQQRFSHAELAALAVKGGADTVQFRDKGNDVRHVLRQAQETARVCNERQIPLIIDDRVDVALAVQADGVHLGQLDLPVAAARRILGRERIVGASATTIDQALRAEDDGADYIGFGPVFPTSSKANPASVKGLAGLRDVCRAVAVPVIAIAGITVERIEMVLEAGAHGAAVMSAISLAADPAEATRRFRLRLDELAGSLDSPAPR